MKFYKFVIAFSVLCLLSIGNIGAYNFSKEETDALESFQTISLSFDLKNENINALSVKLRIVGAVIENVEVIDGAGYLVLPECENEEIFTSDQVCFSLGSSESFEDGAVFATIDLEIVDPNTAEIVKLDGNLYTDGENEYMDIGQFPLFEEADSTSETADAGIGIVSNEQFDYGTQVYLAASALVLLVFVFSLIFIANDHYSYGLKLTVSFFALVMMVFALYGAYSTYSRESDLSVANIGSNCYDVIDKVCGVNGKTYRNSCVAGNARVEVACNNACPCSNQENVCGNGVCDAGEDVFRKAEKSTDWTKGCPEDCIVCGDGICDLGEADVNTCDTGTSRVSNGVKKFCPAIEGTCSTDCVITKPQETAICGPMDKNGDGKLTIVDFSSFVKVYQKKCGGGVSIQTKPESVCGNQDSNADGTINIIDFSSFKKRYNKDSCKV